MTYGLLAYGRRFNMSREQPPETLNEYQVCDSSRLLGQTGNADTADTEAVVKYYSGEYLRIKLAKTKIQAFQLIQSRSQEVGSRRKENLH